ncbi:MAG: hypothetical protein QXG08_01180 [Candidatus Methanomethyliaceae archaeon]
MKMKKPRIIRDKRGDISSPIILVLITVAALAVAGIVVVWMSTTASRAANTGALVVLGSPTVTAGSNTNNVLYITVKNIGNVQLNIASARLYTYTATVNQNVAAGSSVALSIAFSSSTFTSGQSYSGVLMTDAGTVQFTAICQ